MNQRVQNYPGLAAGGALAADRNRVLRNTYWLLALSMVPTVSGRGSRADRTSPDSVALGMIVFLAAPSAS